MKFRYTLVRREAPAVSVITHDKETLAAVLRSLLCEDCQTAMLSTLGDADEIEVLLDTNCGSQFILEAIPHA